MKKIAVVFVILSILLLLCGCDTYYFDYENLKETVQKIEIIDYDSFTREERLLKVLVESDRNQFLLELSQIEYHFFLGDPPTTKGYAIKLNYKNNDCEIITWAGTTKQGFIKCDKELFEEMLREYYPN